uniref:P27 family phage terminase small subunit n=1 Tax=Lactobacillus jensenii TaxID=109790 RepID=UPI00286FEAC6
EQREQTEKLKKVTENWTPLQKTPPSYMKGTLAATIWQRLIPILQETGVVKQADKATVECLCSAIKLYRESF